MAVSLTAPYSVLDSQVVDVHEAGQRIGSVWHDSGTTSHPASWHTAVCSAAGHSWRSEPLASQAAAVDALLAHRKEQHQ
jgi:hypothetical protein